MKRSMVLILILITLIGSIGVQPVRAAGTVLYVKPTPTGSGNCSSWANACYLQTALATAISGNQIWVAAGTHKPDLGNNRLQAFFMKNGVAIYGGFAGTETQLSQRDFTANVTILSGDLYGNDSGFTNNGENSYHVVANTSATAINNTAILDGFTIQGGNANGTGDNQFGAGMYNSGANPTLANLIITGNSAVSGGGMLNYNSSPSIANVTISGNTASDIGGGMFNTVNSSPTLNSVTFSNNSAVHHGGGMYNNTANNPILNMVTFTSNSSAGNGGGMVNNTSNPTLNMVIFSGNSAAGNGGGMANKDNNPSLTGVTFSNNTAVYGGGVYNEGASPNLINVTFSANGTTATAEGGGMLNNASSATLNNVTFQNNTGLYGAGLMNKANSNGSLTNVTFSGNNSYFVVAGTQGYGGGIFNDASSPTLTNVTFSANSAQSAGGGLLNNNNGNPTLTNVTFSGNYSYNWGAGMANLSSNATILNATFANNTSNTTHGYGGGMYNVGGTIVIKNSTFSGNQASADPTRIWGAGIYSRLSTNLTLINTIIANSNSSGDCVNENGTVVINAASSNNLIESPTTSCGLTNGVSGNIVGSDPNLGTLASNGGYTQTLALQAGSLALNAGVACAGCPVTDQRGIPRPQGAAYDIGAYELYTTNATRYAKPGGLTSGLCDSWGNACELNTALGIALSGDEVWVQAGTYTPSAADRNASFVLKNGIALYGGFAGYEALRTQRDPVANPSILSGDLSGNDVGFTNNDENSYHVVIGSGTNSTAVLDGFTISGGNANSGSSPWNNGAGIYFLNGTPTLTNLVIKNNSASNGGGGMMIESVPGLYILGKITFSGNKAGTAGGGGLLTWSSANLVISDVTFADNSTTTSGGGLINYATNLYLTNATFSGNSATTSGGGLYKASGTVYMSATVIANSVSGGDCVGALTGTSAYNLIESSGASACGLTNGANGNIIGLDPKLSSLADNGGFTPTIAPDPNGPLIDAAPMGNCASIDQRDIARPQEGACDIGAYEAIIHTISGNVGTGNAFIDGLINLGGGGNLATANANGDYSFKVLDGVTLAFWPDKVGYTFSPDSYYIDSVNSDTVANFTATAVTPAISGNAGIAGATITYTGGSTFADSNGNYNFNVPFGWSGTVTPSKSGYTFTPANKTYNTITTSQGGQNYTAARIAGTRFAKPVASGANNCTSWANACTLQTALTTAVSGDEIWVAAGVHKPTTNGDRAVSFVMKNDVAVFGGFAGTETLLSQRNPSANVTILSGDLNGNDSGFTNNGENTYQVVVASNTDSSAILDGFTISGGNSFNGAGVYFINGTPTLTNLIIKGNYASNGGGGMMIESSTNPRISNITFADNFAGTAGGGGLLNWVVTNLTMSNVTFANNSTSTSGGGMISYSASLTVNNATFSGNIAATNGGGISTQGGNLILANTIIANSTGGDCAGILDASSSNNLIEDSSNACGLINGVDGNIIGSDPALGILANNGGMTTTMATLINSPAIDAGDNTICADPNMVNNLDQRGVVRPQHATCDIGAFETVLYSISGNTGVADAAITYTGGSTSADTNGDYSFLVPSGWSGTVTPSLNGYTFTPPSQNYSNVQSNQSLQNYTADHAATVLYSRPVEAGANDCTSWANACTLQTALTNAVTGDEIWVAAGTHKPTSGADRSISFNLVNGVKVYGGFAGTETLRSQRNPSTNATILSGDLNGDDSGFTNNSENTYQVVVASNTDTSAILDGFTISGGNGFNGAGVYFINGAPTLANLIIKNNYASNGGGGMMIESSTNPSISNITFADNFAGTAGGGGLLNWVVTNLTMTNVTFANNSTSTSGGGMVNYSSDVTVSNVTFSDNSATSGGGLQNFSGAIVMKNTILANSTGGDCAGILDAGSSNNLIEDLSNACGLVNGSNGNITGSDPNLGTLANNGGSTLTFSLLPGSPAINSGTNSGCPATDQRGTIRPLGGICDIGSYEVVQAYFADVPTNYWSWSYVERLRNAGITGGCSVSPLNYCPGTSVTRAQMAIFLLRGMHGSTYTPPAATGTKFTDVSVGSFAAAWIEQLANENITSGCGGGKFCPNQVVTRAQMAIFLVRAKHGVAFVPPAATGIFPDVAVGSFGADYIEQLVADGVTSGCGGGLYCPNSTVKRDSMSVFLVKDFNLP